MGCVFSNPCAGGCASTSPPTTNAGVEYASELSSYEAACRRDPEISSFDSVLRRSTSHAISTLAGGGLEDSAVSFETLQAVIGSLLDMNQEAVKIIHDCKKDICRSPGLSQLVEDYFDNSLQTIDFCTVLEQSLKKARDSQVVVHVALQRFAEEGGAGSDNSKRRRYERTLEELRYFKSAGDPFTKEFFQAFHSIKGQQESLLQKLQQRNSSIGRKIKRAKSWRKLSGVIFASAVAAVLICSLVAAVMAAPPVAAALAAASAIMLAPMGGWIDSLWKKYSDTLKGQKEVIEIMDAGTDLAIMELDSIRSLVEKLEVQISSLLQAADFGLNDEEAAVKLTIEEIKKKLEVFMKSVYDLGVQADQCSRDIGRARNVVLQTITKPQS